MARRTFATARRGIASGKIGGRRRTLEQWKRIYGHSLPASGYTPCACRDCMDTAIGGMCNDCEEAGCDGTGECDSPGAYGENECVSPYASGDPKREADLFMRIHVIHGSPKHARKLGIGEEAYTERLCAVRRVLTPSFDWDRHAPTWARNDEPDDPGDRGR